MKVCSEFWATLPTSSSLFKRENSIRTSDEIDPIASREVLQSKCLQTVHMKLMVLIKMLKAVIHDDSHF